jgi:hypothetical protein
MATIKKPQKKEDNQKDQKKEDNQKDQKKEDNQKDQKHKNKMETQKKGGVLLAARFSTALLPFRQSRRILRSGYKTSTAEANLTVRNWKRSNYSHASAYRRMALHRASICISASTSRESPKEEMRSCKSRKSSTVLDSRYLAGCKANSECRRCGHGGKRRNGGYNVGKLIPILAEESC